MLQARLQTLSRLPEFSRDLGKLMSHLGEEREGKQVLKDGRHYDVEMQGEDYTVSAKDGRGVLCRVENGRVLTFELSEEDADRVGQAVQELEKRVADRQKKNARDRGMEY
ncbi:MAG: hypothetical protein KME03_19410 [Aphanocapsa lilacina HA4352-LM1]|jgi:hypothetical protein|nr:hypothetical protein [Aphanocapsa lilacina HA4352-LM1]